MAQLLFTFQEFVDYYGGAGVQHVAMNTNDIIQTVMTNHNISDQFLYMYFKNIFAIFKSTQRPYQVDFGKNYSAMQHQPSL